MKLNVFLIGPMGAGKTSIGKLLAKNLQFEFYDSDNLIEQQTGADIPWIFDIEGEEGFRAREAKVIEQITKRSAIVLATGGGVVLNKANRLYLSTRGIVVYLTVSLSEQLKRTGKGHTRPLLLKKNKENVLEKLHQERDALYLEIADHVIDTDGGSIHTIVETILKKIHNTV